MTRDEEQTIRNLVARLSAPNLDCHFGPGPDTERRIAEMNANGIECVSRIYLDSWIVPALQHLLPESRNTRLARDLSGK